MDDNPHGDEHHIRSHGGLKIRKCPSSKCSSAAGAKCMQKHLLESFLDYGSYIKQEKKTRGPAVKQQPLIIHTVDPEIVMAEPGEFTSVVQRLTGLRETQAALRNIKRKLKGPRLKQSSKITQNSIPASAESPIRGRARAKQQPPSSVGSLIDPSDMDVHPASPSPVMPSSSSYRSALPSPRSGLTTSCSEGYHTDMSTESYDSSHEPSIPAPGWAPSASDSGRADHVHEQVGGFRNEEEDSSDFFLFSFDSYYGNHEANVEFGPASHSSF